MMVEIIMTSPYILKDNHAYKASPNRSFIYFLSFNLNDEGFNKPFYIGHTKNVAKTFSRNKMSDWHYENFKRPVIINIAGSVPDAQIEQAEEELKKLFVKSGCIILSKTWTVKKAEDYLKNKQPIFYDLTAWISRNNVKTFHIVKDSTDSIENIKIISKEKLIQEINNNQQLDTDCLNLAIKIANSFSNETGYSEIVFTNIKNSADANTVKKQLNKIRFIWNIKTKFKPYANNRFYLTKPILKRLSPIKTDSVK